MVKRYAVSDLHGQYNLYKQIKEYIDEDDIVYALGDFGDRGPEPWRTLQAVLDDSQFIYLMGNHDLMLVNSIEYILNYVDQADNYNWTWQDTQICMYSKPIKILTYNGGLDTLVGWSHNPQRNKYYKQLRSLPLEIVIPTIDRQNFIYLSHAGYTPGKNKCEDVEDFIWNRGHFWQEWDSNGDIVIHGHTPINSIVNYPYLNADEYELINGYCSYCGGSKICIDRGAYYSGETVLLDLDTFEGKIFKVQEENVDGAQNN